MVWILVTAGGSESGNGRLVEERGGRIAADSVEEWTTRSWMAVWISSVKEWSSTREGEFDGKVSIEGWWRDSMSSIWSGEAWDWLVEGGRIGEGFRSWTDSDSFDVLLDDGVVGVASTNHKQTAKNTIRVVGLEWITQGCFGLRLSVQCVKKSRVLIG